MTSGQVDSQHSRIIITKSQPAAPRIPHDQKLTQVPPQLIEAGIAFEENTPAVAPALFQESPRRFVLVFELNQIWGYDLQGLGHGSAVKARILKAALKQHPEDRPIARRVQDHPDIPPLAA